MGKTKHLIYNYKGTELPVEIHFERRSSSRISLGKSSILLRVPLLCRGPLLKNQLSWMGQWLEDTFSKQPQQLYRLINNIRPYRTGQVVRLFDGNVQLLFQGQARKTISAQLNKSTSTIVIKHPMDDEPARGQISNAISRALANSYQHHFETKVFDLNQLHFNQPIKEVRLKNNSSNWGSCSSNSIINLSTRLLLVPESVQDYVVIHELAHLIELNHSRRFWKLVENAMPEYKAHEKWLKDFGTALSL